MEKNDSKKINFKSSTIHNDELSAHLESLTNELAKANSLRRSLLRGMMIGVGTAIGATIITGLVIAMLIQFLNIADNVPILNDLLNKINLEEIIEAK